MVIRMVFMVIGVFITMIWLPILLIKAFYIDYYRYKTDLPNHMTESYIGDRFLYNFYVNIYKNALWATPPDKVLEDKIINILAPIWSLPVMFFGFLFFILVIRDFEDFGLRILTSFLIILSVWKVAKTFTFIFQKSVDKSKP